MTPALRQHRAMILCAKVDRGKSLRKALEFKHLLLSEMAKDYYERKCVRGL